MLKRRGAHIAALRKKKGKTQFRLAMEIGVSASVMNRIERGYKSAEQYYGAIAKALGITLQSLYENDWGMALQFSLERIQAGKARDDFAIDKFVQEEMQKTIERLAQSMQE